MEVLRLENLSKYYTSQSSVVLGLTNVNLTFSLGEFVAVTGESGSGKSTLAHILGGILPYESGELYIYGKPTSHYDQSDWEYYRRDLVSFISQDYGILAGNTVFENVESALLLSGVDREKAKLVTEEILEKVELSEHRSKRSGKLSSGQKQRLSIARALAKPSKILIADEPTGNLDKENSQKVIELLKKASEDRLVILITHEFEEASESATRRIMLSDGAVVTDARLREKSVAKQSDSAKQSKQTDHRKKQPHIVGYVALLTLKARPIFTAIVCLFLALTAFITFAFLGTFTVALDDSSTKIYSSEAFFNGDPERIVVMKNEGERFTAEDYEAILDFKYVENIERWGYANDISYYYVPEVDYQLYNIAVNGPNYHPVLNPDDYQITEAVKFIENHKYFRTFPKTEKKILSKGALPERVCEVVSADPDFKVGDSLKIYIRNRGEWSISSYICLTFTVVGETNTGEGIYFSDKLAATLSHASACSPENESIKFSVENILPIPYMPGGEDDLDLKDNEICISHDIAKRLHLGAGSKGTLTSSVAKENMTVDSVISPTYIRTVLVSEATFDKIIDLSPANQISVYIKDHAYADRVMRLLSNKGYVSISPFELGATETDTNLANERLITLAVCLGSLILLMILQVILLRAMFSSLNTHFRLMYDIGLTVKAVHRALSLIMSVLTLIGEILCVGAVTVMNSAGVHRIVSIFKYLEWDNIVVLFAVHIVSLCLAFISVSKSMKASLSGKAKYSEDIDFPETEAQT